MSLIIYVSASPLNLTQGIALKMDFYCYAESVIIFRLLAVQVLIDGQLHASLERPISIREEKAWRDEKLITP